MAYSQENLGLRGSPDNREEEGGGKKGVSLSRTTKPPAGGERFYKGSFAREGKKGGSLLGSCRLERFLS